jgi:diadenosine tetraphosphatase ApaH/serine/threonine PP2A family protein phosphatase
MLAVLYDVHGNLAALEAVLRDAEAQGCDAFLLGGDYALFGPQPRETVDRLGTLGAEWIRGNGERWTANPLNAPGDDVVQGAVAASRAELGDELLARLADLPEQVVRDGVRYCHASPVSDVRSFLPQPGEDEDELLEGIEERRLVFGHTHLPFRRETPSGIELVNPGSVGMPFDGDTRAAYAVVADDGRVEHRRVEYDSPRAAASLVRDRFGDPWSETVARRIERASFAV